MIFHTASWVPLLLSTPVTINSYCMKMQHLSLFYYEVQCLKLFMSLLFIEIFAGSFSTLTVGWESTTLHRLGGGILYHFNHFTATIFIKFMSLMHVSQADGESSLLSRLPSLFNPTSWTGMYLPAFHYFQPGLCKIREGPEGFNGSLGLTDISMDTSLPKSCRYNNPKNKLNHRYLSSLLNSSP